VRVICKDVGGSFGIKVHIYADEMATYALSKLLRRPPSPPRVPAHSRARKPKSMRCCRRMPPRPPEVA